MRVKRIGTIILSLLVSIALSGCTAMIGSAYDSAKDEVATMAPKQVKTSASNSMKTLTVDRIAILPIVDDPGKNGALAPGAADAITAELYSQVALAGGWEMVPQDDVTQELQNLPPSTPGDLETNAFAIGRLTSADGVLFGTVEKYTDRSGVDDSSAKPAAVKFLLQFLDMKSGKVVWTSSFDKEQKSFSQSLASLANFVQKEGRWVHAQEVAQVGVQQSVDDLHRHLTFASDAKHFETGTYGQLKSGQQRYNTNMGKAGLY